MFRQHDVEEIYDRYIHQAAAADDDCSYESIDAQLLTFNALHIVLQRVHQSGSKFHVFCTTGIVILVIQSSYMFFMVTF